ANAVYNQSVPPSRIRRVGWSSGCIVESLGASERVMSTLVVIPTFNEAGNLPRLVPAILATPTVSVLIVDDNSPDGSGQIADDRARADPRRVSVLHRPAKTGLGTAYVEGFRAALQTDASHVVQMDADFSHNP